MNYQQTDEVMKTFKIYVDDREKETEALNERISHFGCPAEWHRLNFGDYSATVILPDGTEHTLENTVVIERKMDLPELCKCFTSERDRFKREFERAKEVGAKVYLLIEHGSWEWAYSGAYRSKMSPKSLIGSLTTWLARYNCQIIFCQQKTTGQLIYDILFHEMRESLYNLEPQGEETPRVSKQGQTIVPRSSTQQDSSSDTYSNGQAGR